MEEKVASNLLFVLCFFFSFLNKFFFEKSDNANLSLVVFASNNPMVRSERTFFSHKLYSNGSEISVGKKVSGSLKVSFAHELGTSLLEVLAGLAFALFGLALTSLFPSS